MARERTKRLHSRGQYCACLSWRILRGRERWRAPFGLVEPGGARERRAETHAHLLRGEQKAFHVSLNDQKRKTIDNKHKAVQRNRGRVPRRLSLRRLHLRWRACADVPAREGPHSMSSRSCSLTIRTPEGTCASPAGGSPVPSTRPNVVPYAGGGASSLASTSPPPPLVGPARACSMWRGEACAVGRTGPVGRTVTGGGGCCARASRTRRSAPGEEYRVSLCSCSGSDEALRLVAPLSSR